MTDYKNKVVRMLNYINPNVLLPYQPKPPDWPIAGTTKASAALNLLIKEIREIVEVLVSETKHT